MKRFGSLKLLSRTVHNHNDHDEDDHHHHHQDQRPRLVDDDDHQSAKTNNFTVWRKSLLINCNGFTVIDSVGDLSYRVDNYIVSPKEIILMDGSGKSVLTLRRQKKLGLVDNWLVYEGEFGDPEYRNKSKRKRSFKSKQPIFCVRKNIINLVISPKPNTNYNNNKNKNVIAEIFGKSSDFKKCIYTVEGCYANRSCRVVEKVNAGGAAGGGLSRKVVAETRKKQETVGGVCFGTDVFELVVRPGFDSALAMALVLLLDQMFS